MNLEAIYPKEFRPSAAEALGGGDWRKFLNIASDKDVMRLWYDNKEAMEQMGVYEESLLHAWARQRVAGGWTLTLLTAMLNGDREKFAALAPLPPCAVESDGKVTLYRGVENLRREVVARLREDIPNWRPPQKAGLSWTLDIETARRFAVRWFGRGIVCKARVDSDAIWAYVDSREEQECLIPVFPKRVKVGIIENVENQTSGGYVPKITSVRKSRIQRQPP